jgi:hypothetical protein
LASAEYFVAAVMRGESKNQVQIDGVPSGRKSDLCIRFFLTIINKLYVSYLTFGTVLSYYYPQRWTDGPSI